MDLTQRKALLLTMGATLTAITHSYNHLVSDRHKRKPPHFQESVPTLTLDWIPTPFHKTSVNSVHHR